MSSRRWPGRGPSRPVQVCPGSVTGHAAGAAWRCRSRGPGPHRPAASLAADRAPAPWSRCGASASHAPWIALSSLPSRPAHGSVPLTVSVPLSRPRGMQAQKEQMRVGLFTASGGCDLQVSRMRGPSTGRTKPTGLLRQSTMDWSRDENSCSRPDKEPPAFWRKRWIVRPDRALCRPCSARRGYRTALHAARVRASRAGVGRRDDPG